MIRLIEVKDLNKKILTDLLTYDRRVFGVSAVDRFTLPVFTRHGRVFVLQDEEAGRVEIVGLAYLIRDWEDCKMAYLHGFSVSEERRGRGLGKSFMKGIIEHLRQEDVGRLRLTVGPHNESAVKLYEGFGARRLEFRPSEYGTGEDRWLMEIEL